MKEPEWLSINDVINFHEKQIEEHGGLKGIRDHALIESAVDQPKNLFQYTQKTVSIFKLAARYAYGIAKNHAFFDGNKRTAIISAMVFLSINGFLLSVDQEEIVTQMTALAANNISEVAFGNWLEQNSILEN